MVLYRGSDRRLKHPLLPWLSEYLIHPLSSSLSALKLLMPPCLYLPALLSASLQSHLGPASPPQPLLHAPAWAASLQCQRFYTVSVTKNPLSAVEGQYWVGPLCNQQKLFPCFISKSLPEFLASICRILACKLPRQVARAVRTNLLLVGLKSLKIRGFRWGLWLFFFSSLHF